MKSVAFAVLGLVALAGPAAGQAPPGPVWTLTLPKAPAETARLAYGEPGAAAPPLYLSCRPKSGQILAAFDVKQKLAAHRRGDVWIDAIGRPAPWPISVTISSSVQKTTLRGVAFPSAATETVSSVAVEVSTLAPVIADWRKTQVLRIEAVLETNLQPPAPKAMVSRFLRACG
jgi:hypothetical protein